MRSSGMGPLYAVVDGGGPEKLGTNQPALRLIL